MRRPNKADNYNADSYNARNERRETGAMAKSIIVVGGGIVGVCNALALQQVGHQVTLIDRRRPGRETSFGNAGVLSESSVVVLNNPNLLKSLPKLLLKGSKGLRYSPLFVLKRLGWFIRFLAKSTAKRTYHSAVALRALQLVSLDQHKSWIKQAGVGHLLRHAGWLKVFRTEAAFETYAREMAVMEQVGVKFTTYEQSQLRQLEPGLKPIYCRAVLMDETCGVSSPADLTDAYLEMFVAAGGVDCRGDVTGLSAHDSGDSGASGKGWRVRLADGSAHDADDVVIAAGAWSAEVAGWLGYDIPMAWERGYHMHLEPGDGPPLGRAVHDVDAGFVVVPTQDKVRVTTGIELVDRDAPKNFTQINDAIADARTAHDMKQPMDDEPWMGRRPTLIDSLPIIGAAPRHDGLWFNFGHQHIGLSMGPGSALAITAMIAKTPPPFDVSPFAASRFTL